MNIQYYKLKDGRIWSVSKVTFIDAIDADYQKWLLELAEDDGLGALFMDESDMPAPRYNVPLSLPTEASLWAALKFYKLPYPKTSEELMQELRVARNARLAETDFYLMSDYPADAEVLTQVKTYRQALRDITVQSGAPWDGGGAETPWPVLFNSPQWKC